MDRLGGKVNFDRVRQVRTAPKESNASESALMSGARKSKSYGPESYRGASISSRSH